MKTAQDFIDFFEAIPDDQWCTDYYEKNGRRCAEGHLGTTDFRITDEARTLNAILRSHPHDSCAVLYINDGARRRYRQSTPKARILAALQDAKAKGK